ncbi:MAG: hypothetical protein QXJ69_01605 [Desulfurococcaceae archaeon]
MSRFLLMIPGPSIVNYETLLDIAKPTLSHVQPSLTRYTERPWRC